MPISPVTATHRVKLTYQVGFLAHHLHQYCKYSSTIAGIAQLLCRDGVTTIPFPSAVQYWWTLVSALLYSVDVTGANAQLQARDGTIWNTIASSTPTGAGLNPAVTASCTQLTYVFKDTTFRVVRTEVLEHVLVSPFHYISELSGIDEVQDIAEGFSGTDNDAAAPYQWVKSLRDHYLLPQSLAGISSGQNYKLRRARGLT